MGSFSVAFHYNACTFLITVENVFFFCVCEVMSLICDGSVALRIHSQAFSVRLEKNKSVAERSTGRLVEILNLSDVAEVKEL